MAKQILKNTNLVLKTGFTSILALVLIFGAFSLYQLKTITYDMTNAVAINSKKTIHVILMRDAIRQRQAIMTEMILINDVFKREESRMRFFKLSGQFNRERTALIKLPNTESEKKLLKVILDYARFAQRVNREAVDFLMEDPASARGRNLILTAQASQKKIYRLLGELIKLQNKNTQKFVKSSREQYSETLSLSILFGIIIALTAWLIARVMSRVITQKNIELVQNNQQLEKVSIQALEATRTKSEFLAIMSHEIRTPLTSIIGFAEVLAEPTTKIEDRENLTKTIVKNGRHLLKIINDILDISKIEANRMEFENTYFSPVELINDVEDTIKNQFKEKGIQLYIEYQFPIPNVICNDVLRIKQIILNLCSNALKFTKSGKVTIKIHSDIDNEKIYFTVIDSGIGLTDEQISKIFDAFTQADSSTTRQYGGTGLGLSLSKQFAEKMGGTITVESLLDIGSQFSVSIRTGKIDKQQLITGEPELPEKNDSIKYQYDFSYHVKGNILIAEDNHDNQQLLSILLSETGAKLTFVENGQHAVDKALAKHYDLIFMDMQMPVMGGIEATKLLRQASYEFPIIALTANAMKSDHDMCISAGCNDFLTKPINKEKLFHTIYKYLEIDSEVDESKLEINKNKDRSEKLQALIKSFVKGIPLRMESIKKSRNEKNWQEMKNELHKIKGVGTSMGFPDITLSAAKLEAEVMRENENEIEIDKLLVEMNRVCEQAGKSIQEQNIDTL